MRFCGAVCMPAVPTFARCRCRSRFCRPLTRADSGWYRVLPCQMLCHMVSGASPPECETSSPRISSSLWSRDASLAPLESPRSQLSNPHEHHEKRDKRFGRDGDGVSSSPYRVSNSSGSENLNKKHALGGGDLGYPVLTNNSHISRYTEPFSMVPGSFGS